MTKKADIWMEGHRAGFTAAMLKAARIADSHRAMNLDSGHTIAGAACSSVAAFIVQAARDAGCWDDSLPQPLVRAKSDGPPEAKAEART